jgi:hypothetical protein
MAVIAHHKVVVLLEGVLCSHNAIKEILLATALKAMTLINRDSTTIEGYVIVVEFYALTTLRYPQRAEVIEAPASRYTVRDESLASKSLRLAKLETCSIRISVELRVTK